MIFPSDYVQGLKILDDLYENRISNPEFNIFPSPGWGTGTPPDPHRSFDRLGISQYSHNYLTSSSSSSSSRSGDDITQPTRTNEKLSMKELLVTEKGGEVAVEEAVEREEGGIAAFRWILLVLAGLNH